MKEWQRFNVAQDQQVQNAIAFVEKSLRKLRKAGWKGPKAIINIDYPAAIVRAVAQHYSDNPAIEIGSSLRLKRFKRGFKG